MPKYIEILQKINGWFAFLRFLNRADDDSVQEFLLHIGSTTKVGEWREKLKTPFQKLDDFEKKYADEENPPNFDNLQAIFTALKEAQLLWELIKAIFINLKYREGYGFRNAIRILAYYCGISYVRQLSPLTARIAEAIGVLEDEQTVVQRAFYNLLPFSCLQVKSEKTADTWYNWQRAAFLWSSVLNIIADLEPHVKVNFGWDDGVPLSPFNAENRLKFAERILNFHYTPKENNDYDGFMLSYGTIPVAKKKAKREKFQSLRVTDTKNGVVEWNITQDGPNLKFLIKVTNQAKYLTFVIKGTKDGIKYDTISAQQEKPPKLHTQFEIREVDEHYFILNGGKITDFLRYQLEAKSADGKGTVNVFTKLRNTHDFAHSIQVHGMVESGNLLGKDSGLELTVDAQGQGGIRFGAGYDTRVDGTIRKLALRLEKKFTQSEEKFFNQGAVYFDLGIDTFNDPQNKLDLSAILGIDDITFNLNGKNRDGFLATILPDKDTPLVFSTAVGYSLRRGLIFEGIEVNDHTLFDPDESDDQDSENTRSVRDLAPAEPSVKTLYTFKKKLNKKFFKVITIQNVQLAFKKTDNPAAQKKGYAVDALLDFTLDMKRLQISVIGMGISLGAQYPSEEDVELGNLEFDSGFKAPSGLGLQISTSLVKGGGALVFNEEKQEYYGAAELSIKNKISVKAFGIIQTKLPSGKKGYSVLLMLSAEFEPNVINLGAGFSITGIGGIIGLNRGIDGAGLRAAVQSDNMDHILFPKDLAKNVGTLYSAFNSIFPLKEDYLAFGLTLKIEWTKAKAKFVEIKAGLLIELDRRNDTTDISRFAIIGVIKVQPVDKKILLLQVNFALDFDFERKMLSLDATLYKSNLLNYQLKGDLIIRYAWGAQPVFIISVGGFHPAFVPPDNLSLPAHPNRLTINFYDTDNFKLYFDCYIALTSNTFQLGANVAAMVKFSKFRVEVYLGFDVLFQFEPFHLIASLRAGLAVYWGSHQLFGGSFQGTLEGPEPWHLTGTVSFSIWILDYDHNIDETWGEVSQTTLPLVDLETLMLKAVKDKNNWSAELRAGTPLTYRKLANSTDLRADPLADLSITQQQLPLGVRIDQLSYQRPKGARKFDLDIEASLGEKGNAAKDYFAPAQFFDLSDTEKLSRDSFELLPAGVSFEFNDIVGAGTPQSVDFQYEEIYFDRKHEQEGKKPGGGKISDRDFHNWSMGNSIHRSSGGRSTHRSNSVQNAKVTLIKENFVIVDKQNGKPLANTPSKASMSEAEYDIWLLRKKNPELNLLVVPESELF